MTTSERKRMIVDAIHKIQDLLVSLNCGEYDGSKSREDRDKDIDTLQQHLRTAHTVLVLVTEEELGITA